MPYLLSNAINTSDQVVSNIMGNTNTAVYNTIDFLLGNGNLGNGLKINGNSNVSPIAVVQSTYPQNYAIGVNDFCISAWIGWNGTFSNPPTRNNRIFQKMSGDGLNGISPGTGFFLLFNASGVVFGTSYLDTYNTNKKIITNTFPLVSGRKHHIFVNKISQDIRNSEIYIDGIRQSVTNIGTIVGGSLDTNSEYTVGRSEYRTEAGVVNSGINNNEYALNGYVFKIFMGNRAATADEIKHMYDFEGDVPSALKTDKLLILDFEEKQGTNIPDSSGSGNDGTAQNFGSTTNLGGGAWVDAYTLNPVTI